MGVSTSGCPSWVTSYPWDIWACAWGHLGTTPLPSPLWLKVPGGLWNNAFRLWHLLVLLIANPVVLFHYWPLLKVSAAFLFSLSCVFNLFVCYCIGLYALSPPWCWFYPPPRCPVGHSRLASLGAAVGGVLGSTGSFVSWVLLTSPPRRGASWVCPGGYLGPSPSGLGDSPLDT